MAKLTVGNDCPWRGLNFTLDPKKRTNYCSLYAKKTCKPTELCKKVLEGSKFSGSWDDHKELKLIFL